MIFREIITVQREKSHHIMGFGMACTDRVTDTELRAFLHGQEKARYDTFRYPGRKQSFVLGRIAAKTAIAGLSSREFNLSSLHIATGVFGFPVVKNYPGNGVQVSISHCGPMALALAFDEGHPAGIDTEKIRAYPAALVKAALTPGEIDLLHKHNIPLSPGCTLLWTIKESLSKILKTGLTLPLSLLEITELEQNGDTYTAHYRNFSQYKAHAFHCGDYITAISLPLRSSADFTTFRALWSNVQDRNPNTPL